MRLTLRTLLAYLDSTLDPGDAEDLKNKIGDSGFATQLVHRIRSVLSNGTLPAPSPGAVGPIEEANVIGEYLDSMLPVEQVAEIERACLESDALLAEVSACHQVLTIAVKKPAEIPQELRKRIYELPDRATQDAAVAGNFSGVTIPPQSPPQAFASDVHEAEPKMGTDSKPVQPVGPDDSGVFDAKTRLRQSEASMAAAEMGAGPAGTRSRTVNKDTLYGGSIRPSRITPWLVSLALVAVLFFALAQLFRPLLNRQVTVAQSDGIEVVQPPAESTVAPPGQDQQVAATPNVGESPNVATGAAVTGDVARNDVATSDAVTKREQDDTGVPPSTTANQTPAVEQQVNSSSVTVDATPTTSDATEVQTPTNVEADPEALATETDRSEVPDVPASPSIAESVAVRTVTDAETVDAEAATSEGDSQPVVASVPPPPPPQIPGAEEVASDADRPQPAPTSEPVGTEVANLISDASLVMTMTGDRWSRVKPGESIVDGTKVFAAPTFRPQLSVPGGEITLVGASQIEWIDADGEPLVLSLDYGRVLIRSKQADLTIPVRMGEETITLQLAEPETLAALEVTHFRAPGFDPLQVENRIPVASTILVEGAMNVESGGNQQALQTGQVRRRRGRGEPEIVDLQVSPEWIAPADVPLDASARSGLLELLDGFQPLELQLREATLFRRSEVAALAGRTLLGMSQADVYFGGDGLFNEPKQRTYWPDHFAAIRHAVDRSAESAQRLHDSIVRMDAANATELLRLLTGFTQKQLAAGADVELVKALDSPSMAVRVFALENLDRITGTTLYFRADQDNAVRRAPIIKKWEARQRKGDIRWQE